MESTISESHQDRDHPTQPANRLNSGVVSAEPRQTTAAMDKNTASAKTTAGAAPCKPDGQPREKPIGELLVESGSVKRSQLDHALRVQGKLKKKKRIGRVLVELGYITEDAMRDLLKQYSRRVRLGDLLVEREFLDPNELERALAAQKLQPNLRLGEILVNEKFLTEKTFCDALALYLNMDRIAPDFKRLDWGILGKVSISFLEQNQVLPYIRQTDELLVLVSESHQKSSLTTLRDIFSCKVRPALCTRSELQAVLLYIRERPSSQSVRDLNEDAKDTSVSAMLDRFISKGIEMGASDIHVEPMDNLSRVRFRVDGQLLSFATFPKDLHKSFTARAKIVAGADIAEMRNHQDGKAQVAYRGHPVDLRFSLYVTVHGECLVIRILNPVTNLMGLDSLGLSKYNFARYTDEVILSSTGIVLTTGPTGSGKTTTLYSTLQYQLEDGSKIITVEDPVEYILPGLVQCSVDERAGRTFTDSLRHIMRQDPDVIVLGEMRDVESAEIAIHASLTGHKVYSTFHTEDATGALVRLVQMGIESYMVSSTVLAVLAQRLLRRICSFCRETYVPNIKHLRRLGVSPSVLKINDFKHGHGCDRCHGTGYLGRVPIHELLIMDDRVRDGILRDVSNFQVRELAVKHAGMVTMAEDALYKVFMQETTFEEVISRVPITSELRDYQQISHILETSGAQYQSAS